MSSTIPMARLAEAASRAITEAGGGAQLARALRVKRASVQGWKSTGIPPARVPAVSQLTKIPFHELRPDLFDAPDADAVQHAAAQAARRKPADLPTRHPAEAA